MQKAKAESMREYEVIKNYRDNDVLRRSFNRLAVRTFGLDFEDWYQNGYWKDQYTPYSIVIDGEVAANVSVNRTDFILAGCGDDGPVRFIQLGTVMTEERYRNRGLVRRIMEEIDRDCEGRADGVYLFANDSVLDFYPKFGFRRAEEVLHTKSVSISKEADMVQIPMRDKKDFDRLERAIQKSRPAGAFTMTGNSALTMFYVTKFMRDNIYYDKESDTYAIAEIEDGRLFLHNVFSPGPVDINRVAEAFGREIREVALGFTPGDRWGFTAGKVQEEDTTLFVKGEGFRNFQSWGVRIPSLSHA